jgi:hypothetical protein
MRSHSPALDILSVNAIESVETGSRVVAESRTGTMEERRMNRVLVSSAALLIVAAAVSEAADVKSGLRPGQRVQAFNVQDITGPNAGKKLCYR